MKNPNRTNMKITVRSNVLLLKQKWLRSTAMKIKTTTLLFALMLLCNDHGLKPAC